MEVIIYSLKVAAIEVAFYLMFKLLVSRETFHRLNRFLLLGSALMAFALPLFNLQISTSSAESPTAAISHSVVMLEEVFVGANQSTAFDWRALIISIYYIGIVACAVRLAMSILSLMRIIRKGTSINLENGIRLKIVDGEQAPFSWFNYVIINKKDYEENAAEILTHEAAHVHFRHSIDLLLCDLMCCAQWFNPAIWLIRRELCAAHEYEADKAVLDSGINAKQYQLLLVKKAAGPKWNSIANSFNHSKLKYRITMMTRKESAVWTRAKVLYVVPIAIVALVAFANVSCSEEANKNSEIFDVNNQETAVNEATEMVAEGPDEVFMEVEEMPQFPGGEVALQKYLAESLSYPHEAQEAGAQGRVLVTFVVKKNGEIGDVKVAREVNPYLDAEAIRVVKSMPKWTPGKQRGFAVNVQFTVPINFALN